MLESHRSDFDGTFDQHQSDLENHRDHLLSRLSDVSEGHDSSHSALQDALNQHRLDLNNRFGSPRSEFEAAPPPPRHAPSLAYKIQGEESSDVIQMVDALINDVEKENQVMKL